MARVVGLYSLSLKAAAPPSAPAGRRRHNAGKEMVLFYPSFIFHVHRAAPTIRVLCALLSPQRLRLPEGAHRWHGVARAATVGARPESKPYGSNLLVAY